MEISTYIHTYQWCRHSTDLGVDSIEQELLNDIVFIAPDRDIEIQNTMIQLLHNRWALDRNVLPYISRTDRAPQYIQQSLSLSLFLLLFLSILVLRNRKNNNNKIDPQETTIYTGDVHFRGKKEPLTRKVQTK